MASYWKRLAHRAIASAMLPHLKAARGLIGLCHHRFEAESGSDPIPGMAVRPEALARQVEILSELGRFVSMEEAFDHDPAPGLRFWLSLDDGYADNAEILPPLLERLGIPATIFVTHGFVSGEVPVLEHDRAVGFAPPAMNAEQLRTLAKNPRVTIGCHTFSHRRLEVFHEPDWRHECVEARQWTASLTDAPVRDLAYPFGGVHDFDWLRGPEFLMKQGFRSICSNFGGWNHPQKPDRIGSGDLTVRHFRRVPMIASDDRAELIGWIMKMATRGSRRLLQ